MTEPTDTKRRSRRLAPKFGLSGRLAAVAGTAGLAVAGTLLALDGGSQASLAAAFLCVVVVLAAGHLLLVRPMRRLAGSMAALDSATPAASGDELAQAAQAVDAVARQLRMAEWRQARLGAIAAGAANVSHDLRGTLAPALLAAERLQMNAEPGIKRIGDITVRAVERAIELVRGSLDFVREGHQAASPARFPLRDAVAEAVATARAAMPGVAIEVTQEAAVEVSANRENVVRSLCYLLRRCGARPATKIVVTIGVASAGVTLDVTGDGALPAASGTAAFLPFGDAAGLELAIARDLARSNGGSVVVQHDGPRGPALRLSLPIASPRPAVPQPVA